ncbi:MAG: tetratricopeptide repeat protein, partial [Acidobacteria bacterium]|nr:tetratricopeptide repeat protein [Acidobacteriota bacterium]
RHLPPDHWRLASADSLRGEILTALGRPEEAEPLLERSLERLAAARGPEHRSTRRARARLEAFSLSRR